MKYNNIWYFLTSLEKENGDKWSQFIQQGDKLSVSVTHYFNDRSNFGWWFLWDEFFKIYFSSLKFDTIK